MSSALAVEAPRWEMQRPVAAGEGHVLLNWAAVDGADLYEVVEGEKVRYRGPDLAFFASGLVEGAHEFRVRADGGAWSEPLEVVVNYPAAWKVWTLLGVGLVVFGLTVATVVKGSWRGLSGGDAAI